MKMRVSASCSMGFALLLAGCGGGDRPDLVPATGTLTLNGAPVPDAQLAFKLVTDEKSKYGRPSRAVTDAAGKFAMSTYGQGDGAPLGKYQVGVMKREVVGKLPDDYNEENAAAYNITYKWITPRTYADPGSSGLTVEVTEDGLVPATIELTSSGEPEIERTGPQVEQNAP